MYVIIKSRALESVLRSLGPKLKTEAPASNLVALHKSPRPRKIYTFLLPIRLSYAYLHSKFIIQHSDEVRHYCRMITEIC